MAKKKKIIKIIKETAQFTEYILVGRIEFFFAMLNC